MIKEYIRKPKKVQAIQLTKKNFLECQEFCPILGTWKGEARLRQARGWGKFVFVGNFIVKDEEGNYLIYGKDEFYNKYEKGK